MKKKTKYSWKITLKKALIVLAEVLVVGIIAYLADNNLYLVLIPALEAVRNWLKHRKKQ